MATCEHARKMLVGEYPRLVGVGIFSWQYICRDCGYWGEVVFAADGPDEIEAFRKATEEAK